MPKKLFTVSFTKDKDTKGTHVYAENGEPDKHKIGKLYIKKSAVTGEAPAKIEVTVNAG